jgi:hypothetical protein
MAHTKKKVKKVKKVIKHLKHDVAKDEKMLKSMKKDAPKKKHHVKKHKKESKVEKVMHEFKHGELHSGSKKGPKVKSRSQAIAIALSEARKAGQLKKYKPARKVK